MASVQEAWIITLIFGSWLLAYHAVAMVYLALVVSHRDTFEVRIRLPSLTVVEVLVVQLCATTILLREILVAWGKTLPSHVQDLAFVAAMAVVVAFIPVRCLQLIVVFDPATRKAYHQHFKLFKTCFLLVVSATCILLYTTSTTKGCFKM